MSWTASLAQTCCQFWHFQGLDAQNKGFAFLHTGRLEGQCLSTGHVFSKSFHNASLRKERQFFRISERIHLGQDENFQSAQVSKLTPSFSLLLSLYSGPGMTPCLLTLFSLKSHKTLSSIIFILLTHEEVVWFVQALTAAGGRSRIWTRAVRHEPTHFTLNYTTLPSGWVLQRIHLSFELLAKLLLNIMLSFLLCLEVFL